MIRELLFSTLPGTTNKRTISVILALVVAFWLAGCLNFIVIDEPSPSDLGEITIHQTGGFAGFSRTTSIKEAEDSILYAYTDHTTKQHKESPVSSEDMEQFWQKLEENDVFTLPTNQDLLATVADGFFFEVTVQRGEKYNKFSVYAPGLMVETGEARYSAIMQEIDKFAELQSRTAQGFTIADMPITDVSVSVLESLPLQLHVVVKGYLSDSCTRHHETTQRSNNNTVYVNITTKRPNDAMCAMVITEVTIHVPLEGGFLPGRYKIIVNDVEKDIEV